MLPLLSEAEETEPDELLPTSSFVSSFIKAKVGNSKCEFLNLTGRLYLKEGRTFISCGALDL